MQDWLELSQQLQNISNTIVRFFRTRRRENASIALSALLFFFGYSFNRLLPDVLKRQAEAWNVDVAAPAILFTAAFILFGFAVYRILKLVYTPELPPPTNRPSVIKGPLAFTPSDGELFRKLGREEELRKLLNYIEDDQTGVIVMQGASGSGKTSLLRAGLTDVIKDKNIRYHYWEAVPNDSGKALLLTIRNDWETAPQQEKKEGEGDDGPQTLDDLVSPPKRFGARVIVLDQFEQLGEPNGPVFKFLRKLARQGKPPYRFTWIIAFRREYQAAWRDFIIPEQESGFFPSDMSLRLFTAEQARDVISQLIQSAGLTIEQKVVDNLIDAATVDGEVSSVDIGIGLLVLSELFEQQGARTVTQDMYYFAGGAQGLLTQYISRRFDSFTDEDRKMLMNAMLALRDPETNQRVATGKTLSEISDEIDAINVRRLKVLLERLTQRDIRLLEQVTVADGAEARYRLPHERLIPAINRLAGKLIGELEDAKLKFLSAYSAWKSNDSSRYLLRGGALSLIKQNKLKIHWGSEKAEKLQFLKRSLRARLRRRIVLGFGAAVLTMIFGFVYYVATRATRTGYPPEFANAVRDVKRLTLFDNDNPEHQFLNSEKLEQLRVRVPGTDTAFADLIWKLKRCPNLSKLDVIFSYSSSSETADVLATDFSKLSPGVRELSVSTYSEVKTRLTLPNSLSKLTLDVSENKIEELPALPADLTELSLDIYRTRINSIPPLPENLKKLQLVVGRRIEKLPVLPPRLEVLVLDASSADLTEIPALPASLRELQLNAGTGPAPLPALPDGLRKMTVDLTNGNKLPALPSGVEDVTFEVKYSQVKDLPALPGGVKRAALDLVDDGAELILPPGFRHLSFELRKSKKLPALPPDLESLSVNLFDSTLRNLPALPEKLVELKISESSSELETLPALPASLKKLTLGFGSDRLSRLPDFPAGLAELKLEFRQVAPIVHLPPLPKGLSVLSLDYKEDFPDESLELPGGLTELSLRLRRKARLKTLPPLPARLNKLTLSLSDAAVGDVSDVSKIDCTELDLNLNYDQLSTIRGFSKTVTDLSLRDWD